MRYCIKVMRQIIDYLFEKIKIYQIPAIIIVSMLNIWLFEVSMHSGPKFEPYIIYSNDLVSTRYGSVTMEAGGGNSKDSGSGAVPAPLVKDYVASVNGSKYYHRGCGGVGRIKEENKVWFATPEEAQKAGYEPAKNCPVLSK